MGPLLALNHLANLAAPAVVLACLLPLLGRLLGGGAVARFGYGRQALLHGACALAITLGGLWLGGADGRMLSYVAMTVAAGTLQWWMLRGGGRRK